MPRMRATADSSPWAAIPCPPGAPVAPGGPAAVALRHAARLPRPRLELGLDGGGDLAQVDRLVAQRDLAVEAAEVEQGGREAGEGAGLAPRGGRAAAGA